MPRSSEPKATRSGGCHNAENDRQPPRIFVARFFVETINGFHGINGGETTENFFFSLGNLPKGVVAGVDRSILATLQFDGFGALFIDKKVESLRFGCQ